MSWNVYIKGFRSYLQLERSLSPNTIESYIRDVEKLKSFTESNLSKTEPTNIILKDLRSFLTYLFNLSIEATSQARILSGIKAFYKYLLLEDLIEDDPTTLLEAPRTSRKLPDVLSVQEIDKMIEIIDKSKPEGERNRAIVEVLYGCGLRVSELVNLQISNLYLKEGFIRVIGKGDKERLVPIGKIASKYITIYLDTVRPFYPLNKGGEDILFLNRRGNKLTRNMIFIIIQKLAKDAGINKTISPHTLRHSFASDLVNNGADLRAVQDMLGHESITTTEIYAHLDKGILRDTILKYHPRNKGISN